MIYRATGSKSRRVDHCKHCGGQFETSSRRIRYCSPDCSLAHNVQRQRAAYKCPEGKPHSYPDSCGVEDHGIASAHVDLSAYGPDEVPAALRAEGYGGDGLSGSDDFPGAVNFRDGEWR